ncbi:unnamed protein product [Aspergillus oryzae]|nr:unnamed protein product [Aspergillus oryzae]GMF95638.1 unnamed protein product [Aspergillus oryzae]
MDFLVRILKMTPEPTCPIPLTYAKHRALTTLKLEYIYDLPEYPTSHIHGYAYVVSARGRSQTEMEQVVQEHTTCEVVFNGLVPVDISQCPYILFTSHGVHKHPPPPSTKPRHMSQETSRKRRRSSSSSVSESHSTLPQPPSSQRSSRSSSRSTSQNDNEYVSKYQLPKYTYQSIRSIRSSQYPRRVASPNALTSEQRREELELRKLEAYRKQREAELKQLEIEIEKQEEENRLMRLENEKLWLKLMEEGIPFSRSRTSRN